MCEHKKFVQLLQRVPSRVSIQKVGFQSKKYMMIKEANKCFSSKLSGKGNSSKNATVKCIQVLYIHV